MSKHGLNKLIEESLTDKSLNAEMQKAHAELQRVKQQLAERVLAKYDLTAEEREAVIAKDVGQLSALGVANILKRADWCTGD